MPPLKFHPSCCAFQIALLAILACCNGWSRPIAAKSVRYADTEHTQGTLTEIKDANSVALLIIRSSVLDASGSDEPLVAEALAAEPRESIRHRYPYRVISRKLNDYMRKYRSMRPVYEIGQADFIIYFKLVEYRRLLNGYYPYGELFIIVTPRPEERRPARVIWRTKKVRFAEDAVKDFVKELKRVRQER